MWVIDKDSKVGEFIDNLISNRTELSPRLLELISTIHFGGSVTNRFSDVMSKYVSRRNISKMYLLVFSYQMITWENILKDWTTILCIIKEHSSLVLQSHTYIMYLNITVI